MLNERTYLYGLDAARHADFHRNIHVSRGDGSAGVTHTQSTGKSTIPRRDAGRNRKPQTVNLSIMLQLHDILDLDLDSLARRDIPDAGAEDISGVLFQQACGLVSLNGRLVCRARVLLLFYDALDEPSADIASEDYDGAGLVQREGVLGAGDWGDGGGVDEHLGEQSAGGGVVEFRDRGQGDLGEPLRPRAVEIEVFEVDTCVWGNVIRHVSEIKQDGSIYTSVPQCAADYFDVRHCGSHKVVDITGWIWRLPRRKVITMHDVPPVQRLELNRHVSPGNRKRSELERHTTP
jgi:hypothetical protein